MIRKCLFLLCCLLFLWINSACALVFTDANGRSVEIENPERVVSLYNSYGDAWITSGGELAGSIADPFEDSRLNTDTVNLGSHLSPNMELLFSLDPDFVLLSADVSSHGEIGRILENAGIACAYFSTPDWRSYMENIRLFTRITGRENLYQGQLENVQKPIEEMLASVEAGHADMLLIRANSSSVKCKNSEGTVAGHILKDMGFINLADGNSPLCEGISMEEILMQDPDYIFALLQGSDTDAAEKNLKDTLLNNPAWNSLTAVREGRFYMLERELFHYHPNARWAEAYARILEIIEGAS